MKKRWIIAILPVMLVVVAFGVSLLRDPYRLRAKDRRAWKEHALADITRRIGDSTWLTNEIATVNWKSGEDGLNWLSDHLITMKNGEWIVYSATCSKQPPGIHDIFLGQGSNGKYYYSTFHFCVGMCSLAVLGADQPTNLVSFADSYFLREFDGQSDECLKPTWPVKRR